MIDQLLKYVIDTATQTERAKWQKAEEERARNEAYDVSIPRPYSQFWAVVQAGTLVAPCQKKAAHHRTREKFYVERLEVAEKELREKGVSMEVFDSAVGGYANTLTYLCSGSIAPTQNFQPRVDQRYLDAVKWAKAKMLEHKGKAETYEKYAVAYSFNPTFSLKLDVEAINFYGLGGQE